MSVEIPVRPDEFLLNLLEDDRDVPCNVAEPDCQRHARWAVRCPSCGFDHQACDRHRKAIDRMRKVPALSCRACMSHRIVPIPVPWRPL